MGLNFAQNSRDFGVVWKTAKYVLSGGPAYSVLRDGPWVFKYPPWLLTPFLPFGLLSLETAKAFYGALQAIAFLYVLRWTAQASQKSLWAYLTALLFWGLWQVNAQDGQVSLLLLATWLWAGNEDVLARWTIKSTALVAVLPAKIFTVYPALGLRLSWKAIRNIALISTLILVPLSLPALWGAQDHSVSQLVHSYIEAMLSGGKLLGYDGVRGRFNQGLTGLCLRLMHIPPEKTFADIICFFIVGSIIAILWSRISRNLPFKHRWVGWIGLTPVVHPLPYWYSFVMTYPLAAITLSAALSSRKKLNVALAALGVAMIAILTEKTLGTFGAALELLSIKSWGVVLCCYALVVSQKDSTAQ
jgi:hypothetical protein